MAKKMTVKEMQEMMAEQAKAMQAQIDALNAKLAEADARTLAAQNEKQALADRLEAELKKDQTDDFDASIQCDSKVLFNLYAIPMTENGEKFAYEKKAPAYVPAKAEMTLDDILTKVVAIRPRQNNEMPGDGVYVFSPDGTEKVRHYVKKAYELYPMNSTGVGTVIEYEDLDLPEMIGGLETEVRTYEEIGELVWQRLNRSTYVRPQFDFSALALTGRKLSNYKTAGTDTVETSRKTRKAEAERKARTAKGSKAAYIAAFDALEWGEYTLLCTDGLEDRRKVQRDGNTLAAVIVKGNGYEITATEAKFLAAGINVDGAKKHGSRYVVTLDTPAQVKAFCDCQ